MEVDLVGLLSAGVQENRSPTTLQASFHAAITISEVRAHPDLAAAIEQSCKPKSELASPQFGLAEIASLAKRYSKEVMRTNHRTKDSK
jgi:hypothetical protein